MADKPISVEIYTASHRILGRIHAGAPGLFSYLNLPTQSYIQIEGAHINRLSQPTRMIARFPAFWLVKTKVEAILVSNRAELGRAAATRTGYVAKSEHWVHMMLGSYEVVGLLEAGRKLSFAALMFEGEGDFVPLYTAELTSISFTHVHAEAGAMLFNRKLVSGLAVLPRKDIPHRAH